MDSFQLWYTYFDSFVIQKKISSNQLLQNQFKAFDISKQNWPVDHNLPILNILFSTLQNLFHHPLKWKKPLLPLQEIKDIQNNLNTIFIWILTEKKYALQYWKSHNKRIQASVTHLYIYFTKIIAIILHSDNCTLNNIENAVKICIVTKQIQNVANQFLKNISIIEQFMLRKQFQQQQYLTKQFFQQFRHVLNNYGKLTSPKLLNYPKLIEYIALNNIFQLTHSLHSLQKRNIPTLIKKQTLQITKSQKKLIFKHKNTKTHNIYYVFNKYYYKVKQRRIVSCPGNMQNLKADIRPRQILLFRLPMINRLLDVNKLTISTINPTQKIKDLSDSSSPVKSRRNSIFTPYMNKKKGNQRLTQYKSKKSSASKESHQLVQKQCENQRLKQLEEKFIFYRIQTNITQKKLFKETVSLFTMRNGTSKNAHHKVKQILVQQKISKQLQKILYDDDDP